MKRLSRGVWLLALSGAVTVANAALIDTGNGLINHVDANITWTADADLFVTQAAANPDLVADVLDAWNATTPDPYLTRVKGIRANMPSLDAAQFGTTGGTMTYHAALAWINYLNVTNYKGYSDWRLPAHKSLGRACFELWCFPPIDSPIEDGEWFRLFYQELGGVAPWQLVDTHNANFDLFSNIASGTFWVDDVPAGRDRFVSTYGGLHYTNWEFGPPFTQQRVWPVRTGLSSATPPPMGHVVVNQLALSFYQHIGVQNLSQEVEIRSTGTGPSAITTITSGEFSVTNDCPAALAPGATCVATVRYEPVTLGQHVGSMTITADGRDILVSLTGSNSIYMSLAASATTVAAGAPVTLAWEILTESAACIAFNGEAGDGWDGAIAASGSRVVTRSAGSQEYKIRCQQGNDSLDRSVVVTYVMPTVTLTRGSSTITQGESHTLIWTSTNADTCTASGNGAPGSWSGVKATSGSASITETALGLITYTLSCTSSPQAAQSSVQVLVNAAPPPPQAPASVPPAPPVKKGGGAMGLGSLLALLALCASRARRSRNLQARNPG